MATIRKNAPRKTKQTSNVEPNLRHVWLASLGLLVAARRESKAAAQRATTKAEDRHRRCPQGGQARRSRPAWRHRRRARPGAAEGA
jgi:hypothetical protein